MRFLFEKERKPCVSLDPTERCSVRSSSFCQMQPQFRTQSLHRPRLGPNQEASSSSSSSLSNPIQSIILTANAGCPFSTLCIPFHSNPFHHNRFHSQSPAQDRMVRIRRAFFRISRTGWSNDLLFIVLLLFFFLSLLLLLLLVVCFHFTRVLCCVALCCVL